MQARYLSHSQPYRGKKKEKQISLRSLYSYVLSGAINGCDLWPARKKRMYVIQAVQQELFPEIQGIIAKFYSTLNQLAG